MKTRKIWLANFVFAILFSPLLFGQTTQPDTRMFKRFIKEVYTGAGKSYIAEDTRRYDFMKEMFETRISYVQVDGKKYEVSDYTKLSEVPLFDQYNKGLTRDAQFDPKRFNPFKYRLGFYEPEIQRIYVDGTDYLIVIKPQ